MSSRQQRARPMAYPLLVEVGPGGGTEAMDQATVLLKAGEDAASILLSMNTDGDGAWVEDNRASIESYPLVVQLDGSNSLPQVLAASCSIEAVVDGVIGEDAERWHSMAIGDDSTAVGADAPSRVLVRSPHPFDAIGFVAAMQQGAKKGKKDAEKGTTNGAATHLQEFTKTITNRWKGCGVVLSCTAAELERLNDENKAMAFCGGLKRSGIQGLAIHDVMSAAVTELVHVARAVKVIFKPTKAAKLIKSERDVAAEAAAVSGAMLLTSTTTASGNLARQAETTAPAPTAAKVGKHEIYAHYPSEYDMLMARHDCSKVYEELLKVVEATVAGNDNQPLIVTDFGAGTGRIELVLAALPAVKRIFACDIEPPMLRLLHKNTQTACQRLGRQLTVAMQSFAGWNEVSSAGKDPKVAHHYPVCRNEQLPSLELSLHPLSFAHMCNGALNLTQPKIQASSNLVVCAWSLSHANRGDWGTKTSEDTLRRTMESIYEAIDPNAKAGAVVVIETLGHSSPTPKRRTPLHEFLETKEGFEQVAWVRTDYTFQSTSEAHKLCTFFFGSKVGNQFSVAEGAEGDTAAAVLQECTGIWVKKFNRV